MGVVDTSHRASGPFLKVSSKIRSLQEEILSSIPQDGAWEKLSPAQKEAIVNIQRKKILCNQMQLQKSCSRVAAEKRKKNNYKMESETDDSGARNLGTGTHTSSGASLEDDSSDPELNKSPLKKHSRNESNHLTRLYGTKNNKNNVRKSSNVISNVDRMINKQMHKNSANLSNVTIDCRKAARDTRRKSDVFPDGHSSLPYTNTTRQSELSPKRDKPCMSRKRILDRYDTADRNCNNESMQYEKEDKFNDTVGMSLNFEKEERLQVPIGVSRSSLTSESYDSGISARYDNSPVDDFMSMENNKANYRDHSSSPPINPNDNENTQVSFSKWTPRNNSEILKSNLKNPGGKKMNSSLDYRTRMNQDATERYNTNWEAITRCNQMSRINAKYNPYNKDRVSQFSRNMLAKSTGNLSSVGTKTSDSKNVVNFVKHIQDDSDSGCSERVRTQRKYYRSRSLDRKSLDDTSEEDFDFEFSRRNEFENRRSRVLDSGRGAQQHGASSGYFGRPTRKPLTANNAADKVNYPARNHDAAAAQANDTKQSSLQLRESSQQLRVKAKSAWNLSQAENYDFNNPFTGANTPSRADFRARWQSANKADGKSELFNETRGYQNSVHRPGVQQQSNPPWNHSRNPRLNELQNTVNRNEEASGPWRVRKDDLHLEKSARSFGARRRSCDFELDAEPSAEEIWEQRRWQRRSCDIDLDQKDRLKLAQSRFMMTNKPSPSNPTSHQFQSLPHFNGELLSVNEILANNNRNNLVRGRRFTSTAEDHRNFPGINKSKSGGDLLTSGPPDSRILLPPHAAGGEMKILPPPSLHEPQQQQQAHLMSERAKGWPHTDLAAVPISRKEVARGNDTDAKAKGAIKGKFKMFKSILLF